MKWPTQLTLIRHAESAYNAQKHLRKDHPLYREFRQAFEANPVSEQSRRLALEVKEGLGLECGDVQTAITAEGQLQASQMTERLRREVELPDCIYVSPYLRAQETFNCMLKQWPELQQVRLIEDERIREQEFGLRLLYGDWRVMMALHPEQYELHQLQGSYWYRQPQGENIPDVRERNRSWMNTLTRDFAEKRVLAVTHHINILAIRANMERLSAAQFLALDRHHEPKNCSVTIYRGDPSQGKEGRFVLDRYNQVLV